MQYTRENGETMMGNCFLWWVARFPRISKGPSLDDALLGTGNDSLKACR